MNNDEFAIVRYEDVPEPNYELPDDIFVARDRQVEDFGNWLNKVARRVAETSVPANPAEPFKPNLSNPLKSPLVLIYGRGGYGKSTLLGKLHEEAKKFQDGFFEVVPLIDSEKVLSDSEQVFLRHPSSPEAASTPQLEELEPGRYYDILHQILWEKMNKKPTDFKEYDEAKKAVATQLKRLDGEIDKLKTDDKYQWIGKYSGTVIKYLLKASPAGGVIPDKVLETVEKTSGVAINFSAAQLHEVRRKLNDKLATELGDYLSPETRLGRGLGRDLFRFARSRPMLLFFDTYELLREGDELLRLVLSVAGERVGLVMAGRDDLYASRNNSGTNLAGYRNITSANYTVAINFLDGDDGSFSPLNLKEYFEELAARRPHIAALSDEAIENVFDLTLGIPLAVRLVAATYLGNPDQRLFLPEENPDGWQQREELERLVIEEVVQRFLVHAQVSPDDKLRLYALALLRRPIEAQEEDLREATLNPVGVKLKLPGEGEQFYRLQRRYSFVFQKGVPVLHREVRDFLRRWLPEQQDVPLAKIAGAMAEGAFKALIGRDKQLVGLCERLEDEKWTGYYLDWLHLRSWAQPDEAVRAALPLGIAAGVYNPTLNKVVIEALEAVEGKLGRPEKEWWQAFKDGLGPIHSRQPEPEEKPGLEVLLRIVGDKRLTFLAEFGVGEVAAELRAAIEYRVAQAHLPGDNEKAYEGFRLAQAGLQPGENRAKEIRKEISEVVFNLALFMAKEKQQYQNALPLWTQSLELDPNYASAYYNRGTTYRKLERYEEAIGDYGKAIELDPNDADAFFNRASAFASIGDVEKAQADFENAARLEPSNGDNLFMALWAALPGQRPDMVDSKKLQERLKEISEIEPESYLTKVSEGLSLALGEKLTEADACYDQAIGLHDDYDAFFWKGMLYLYRGRIQQGRELVELALENGLPKGLLFPLRWLEKDLPKVFAQVQDLLEF